MNNEERLSDHSALATLLAARSRGAISRREFLSRATALGMTAGMARTLLEAAGPPRAAAETTRAPPPAALAAPPLTGEPFFHMEVLSVSGNSTLVVITTTGAIYDLTKWGMTLYRRTDPRTNEVAPRRVAWLSFIGAVGPLSVRSADKRSCVVQSSQLPPGKRSCAFRSKRAGGDTSGYESHKTRTSSGGAMVRMMRTSSRFALPVTLAVAGMVAVAVPTGGLGAPSENLACTLLTEADAAEIMGGKVESTSPDEHKEYEHASCSYSLGGFKSVTLNVWRLKTEQEGVRRLQSVEKNSKADFREQMNIDVTVRRIEGLGSSAVWVFTEGEEPRISQLDVVKGRYRMLTNVFGVSDTLGTSKKLAQRVLAKLP